MSKKDVNVILAGLFLMVVILIGYIFLVPCPSCQCPETEVSVVDCGYDTECLRFAVRDDCRRAQALTRGPGIYPDNITDILWVVEGPGEAGRCLVFIKELAKNKNMTCNLNVTFLDYMVSIEEIRRFCQGELIEQIFATRNASPVSSQINIEGWVQGVNSTGHYSNFKNRYPTTQLFTAACDQIATIGDESIRSCYISFINSTSCLVEGVFNCNASLIEFLVDMTTSDIVMVRESIMPEGYGARADIFAVEISCMGKWCQL